MNAVTPFVVRPTAMPASSFTAWEQGKDGGNCYPIPIHGVDLPAIEREIAGAGMTRATIFVRETNTLTGKSVQHAYRIRQGQWTGRVDERLKRIYQMKADRLFSLPVLGFQPEERFRAMPGCDAVGRIPNMLEGAR